MARLVIVYHDPGDKRGVEIAEEMASRAGSTLGVEAVAIPMSTVEEGAHGFRSGDVVVALLPARGGHLQTVIEEAGKAGAVAVGPIPAEVLARGMAERLKGCREVDLIYWPAKRFRGEQEEDLSRLAREIAKLTGANVKLTPREEIRCSECMASTTLLPGRVTRRIDSCNPKAKVGYLAEAAMEDIVSWVVEAASKLLGKVER